MPDDTPTGKRLHLERLVAHGMTAKATDLPPADVIDAARTFVKRVLDMHTAQEVARPVVGIMVGLLTVGILFGFASGLVVGLFLSIAAHV